jgi:hypothetical protein
VVSTEHVEDPFEDLGERYDQTIGGEKVISKRRVNEEFLMGIADRIRAFISGQVSPAALVQHSEPSPFRVPSSGMPDPPSMPYGPYEDIAGRMQREADAASAAKDATPFRDRSGQGNGPQSPDAGGYASKFSRRGER